ncbi:MAG: ketoacyl-ACP synthase III [Verrucomicrobia bacterium]|nr:ketoacyl-ACP synthase III [Verrucomicrobiota bacterium]
MTASKPKVSPTLRSASITGTGSCLPNRVLTNADLEKTVETSDEWITSRTGIRERRIAGPDQCTSDLGAEAARRALADAKVSASRVDLIICATITPDMPFPCTACLIQEKIGAAKAACFDIEAACSGFIFGIEIARQFVMTGTFHTVLVIAAEKLSTIVDWKDRNTCVLFGDGAGAAVLQHVEHSQGVLSSALGSSGTHEDLLYMPGGGARNPASAQSIQAGLHHLKMSGKEVYKHAIRAMHEVAVEALGRSQIRMDGIRCIIPHQANMRIIQGLAERLNVSVDRFYINLHRYGNMSAASAAVALDEGAREGRFQRGDHILIIAFGAGLTWGASVIQW